MIALALGGLLAVGPVPAALAHITRDQGPLRVSMGWVNEPAIAGLQNAVEVGVTDASGAPVDSARLEVQVSAAGRRVTLEVRPGEEPGSYAAAIVPTRPGTYSFHLTGQAEGVEIDLASTCSEATFECVIPASELQFPVKDPSQGELAQRLSRELPRAEGDSDTAEQARTLAIVALALAALAIAVALRVRR